MYFYKTDALVKYFSSLWKKKDAKNSMQYPSFLPPSIPDRLSINTVFF